jgi:hypothetical protein
VPPKSDKGTAPISGEDRLIVEEVLAQHPLVVFLRPEHILKRHLIRCGHESERQNVRVERSSRPVRPKRPLARAPADRRPEPAGCQDRQAASVQGIVPLARFIGPALERRSCQEIADYRGERAQNGVAR